MGERHPVGVRLDIPEFPQIDHTVFHHEVPDIDIIDPEDTIMGDIKQKIQEQNELTSKQIEVLTRQNQLLTDNYNKLNEMYYAQEKSYQEAKDDLKRSRSFNHWMMVIAIIAMLAAIVSPIVTIMVS